MLRKIIALAICLAVLTGCFAACGNGEVRKNGRLTIVTTIFPVYDWCREILGGEADGVELVMLLDSGVDLHSYQPTAADLIRISDCDVFAFVGGESDSWTEDALKGDANPDRKTVNLLQALGDMVLEEETAEGMEAGEEDGEEEPEADEHVWLSLKNAAVLVDALADAICAADPDRADAYRANAASYREKLAALDERYAEAAEAGSKKTLLFGDRFPFRYLVEDYGLSYYAAFSGCSAESEASFRTIVFLAEKTDELHLGAICQIESADGSIARTIRDNTAGKDQKILTFDSLQSVTAKKLEEGITYLSVMENNLGVLREALQ